MANKQKNKTNTNKPLRIALWTSAASVLTFILSYVLLGIIPIVQCSCGPYSIAASGYEYSVPIMWPLNKIILSLFVSLFVIALMIPAKYKYSKLIRVLILVVICAFVCHFGSLMNSSCGAVDIC